MKAKHNVILILVSSKWLFPYSGDSSKFLISFVHLYFRSSKFFSRLYHREAPFNPCKYSSYSLSIRSSLRVSSWWLIKDSFHSSIVLQEFSRSYDPPSYTKDKHCVLHMFCFEEFKHSSSCIPKCNYFYLIVWDGVISFLTIYIHVSWFTSCQEWDN